MAEYFFRKQILEDERGQVFGFFAKLCAAVTKRICPADGQVNPSGYNLINFSAAKVYPTRLTGGD